MTHRCACLAMVAVAAARANAMRPEDATRMLQQQFGPQIRQVSATPDRTDDVKLASVLLGHARQGTQEAAMTAAICQAVYDLGANSPEGQELAIEAMRLYGRRVPGQAATCSAKIVAIRRRQYSQAKSAERFAAGEALIAALKDAAKLHADAANYAEALRFMRQAAAVASSIGSTQKNPILAEVRRLTSLERTQRQVTLLRGRLKSTPEDDAAARRLVELYLIELDRPTAAAEFLRSNADETLRTYVPLAAKDPAGLAEPACLELGNWYYSLSEKASTTGKPGMLQRAKTYLSRFLEIHKGSDLTTAKAKLTLEKVEAELKRLAPPEAAGPWIDLLRLVNPEKHNVSGRWWRKGNRLGVTAGGTDRILVPAAPKGDYELKVQFIRTNGNSEVNLILPVGGTSVVLMLSRNGGSASGLSTVSGRYCDDNPTRAPGALSNNAPHTVEAKVKAEGGNVRVSATLDGRDLFEWEGSPSALACARGWALPVNTALGLGTYMGCTTVFTSAQLRMLSGRAARVAYTRSSERDEPGGGDWRTGRPFDRGWRGGRRGDRRGGPRR